MERRIIIYSLVIIAALAMMQRMGVGCSGPARGSDTTSVRTEVKYIYVDTGSVHEVTVIKTIPGKPDTKGYVAAKSYDSLLVQYNNLVTSHTTKKIYSDTLSIDSLGYVAVTDTVHENSLSKRDVRYSYRIPLVTKYVTIEKTAKPTSALYLGGDVNLKTKGIVADGANVGLLYKDKKDRLYGVRAGVDFQGNVTYGVAAYWKIGTKRK